MDQILTDLIAKNVKFVVLGNNKTYTHEMKSCNNHEEADTLIMNCLRLAELDPSDNVHVYATDTDIICPLVSLFNEIPCNNVYVGTKRGEITNIKALREILGELRSAALIAFHCATGCDTVGEFNGIIKEALAKLFLNEHFSSDVLFALTDFQHGLSDKVLCELEKMVCWGYLKKRDKFSSLETLSQTRVHLYKKELVKSEKIPPTLGAFRQHCLRALHQLRQYTTSLQDTVDIRDPEEYGWILIDDEFKPHTTENEVAPNRLIQLVSCNCVKGFCIKKCKCKSNGEPCTDFCGCGDLC